jgi:uncharacterized protein
MRFSAWTAKASKALPDRAAADADRPGDTLIFDADALASLIADKAAPAIVAAPDAAAPAPDFAPQPSFAAFTAGNFVVYRVGTGAAALTSAATAVFLDEYTSTGTLVQSIALPTTDSGANQSFTSAGSSTSEGLLTRSADGRYLLLGGYDAAPGTATIAATTAAAVARVVARVDAAGAIDTTTTLGTAFSTGNIRGVASTNGTDIWAVGSNTGVVYATFGATSSTLIANNLTNMRSVNVFDGQLYVSSGSGALRLDTVGTGTPTVAGQTIAALPGISTTATINSYFFADLSAAVAGVDTLYVADETGGAGLTKYSLVAGTWTLNGTIVAPTLRGLTGSVSGNNVSLIVANATAISGFTDTSGYNGALTGTLTAIVSAGVNTNFRGVALAPVAAAAENQVVTISPASIMLAEGNSGSTAYTFTITRSGGTSGALTFSGTLTPGTGVDATDFTGGVLPTFSGTIAAGATSTTFTVNVAGDTVIEANESFTLLLTGGTNASATSVAIGVASSATGTITNDDVAPTPGTLAIGDATVTEGNSGTTPISFTVTRSGGSQGTISASYTVSFGSGAGNADAGDFATGQTLTGTVSFADGVTSQLITLNVQGDITIEPTETFTVTLSNPTGGTSFTDAIAIGTITTDDTAPVTVFINEFHYDNSGTDANEAIEIAGTAGASLTGYSLVLYNGSNTPGAAVVYATINLSGVIDNEGSGYGALSFAATGLQNGVADGIALIGPGGTVIQFLSYEGVITAAAGTPAAGVTSTDVGVSEPGTGAATNSLQLIGAGGAAPDFTWQGEAPSSFGSLNTGQSIIGPNDTGQISVADVSVAEGNAGIANLTFTVRRAGGSATAASVDYTITLGTADAGDFGAGATFTGTVSFAIGASTATITLPVQGDTTGESNETVTLALSNPIGNITIVDGAATGTITNDDPVSRTIAEIQGSGATSALVGQLVATQGIVTAVDTNGFYIQMAVGDGNAATSDGIFVFTSTAPPAGAVVGNLVDVSGTITEFLGSAGQLTLTQINTPIVNVVSTGNALPAATLIGTGGILPPTADYVSAIAFYEALEGMRVTIDAPLVVSNTNSFGETFVVASGGTGATSISASGGITISPNDLNPERIQIDDDSGVFAGYSPAHTIGDRLSSVTGIFNYGFSSYELIVTEAVTTTLDRSFVRDTAGFAGDATHITIASYNLENMDPSDGKYGLLASDIIFNLRAPDIIAAQEIQDADGAGTGTNLSGVSNAQGLIDAIFAASGITYAYVEVAPTVANSTGGEPNGNIRNGYFYRTDRVQYVTNSAILIEDPAYSGSRRPLVADFVFNGLTIELVNMHSTSRGGSDALFGANQPPNNAGDGARTAQATAARAYVNAALATNPALNIAVLGDFNGFYFETALQTLTAGGVLTNLNALLSVEERYSYLFEGNLQQIDNILVTGGLVTGARYDAVHINSENPVIAGRPTDHDPQITALFLAPVYNGTAGDDSFAAPIVAAYQIYGNDGNDTLTGNALQDLILGGLGNDVLDGAGGNDVIVAGDGDDRIIGGTGTNELYGGSGNDIYVVTNVADSIIEIAGDGIDAVETVAAVYALPGEVENLSFTSGSAHVGLGNGLDNIITGNTGFDVIAGGAGDDRIIGGSGSANELVGGTGDDTYVVAANDTIVELAGEGTDIVETARTSFTLGANIENLTFTDGAGHAGAGNALDNVIRGNTGRDDLSGFDGNDQLFDGGGAADTLIGGAGADNYFVDSVGTTIIEGVNEGGDFVSTSLAVFTLPDNVEGLGYSGIGDFAGVGNAGNNSITGNLGADTLLGLGGDDFLLGSGGADLLIGGNGSDTFFYVGDEGASYDRIIDFTSGTDRFELFSGLFAHTATLEFVSGANAVATSTNSTFLYDTNTGIVSYDADGTGAGAAVLLAQLNTGLTLTVNDFSFTGG